MNDAVVTYEYDLIDIEFSEGYDFQEDKVTLVCEDGPTAQETSATIQYDTEGVPMGTSREEYVIRQQIIVDFLHKWGESNSERSVLNEALNDYIFIKGISLIEAKEHSAKRYKSTRAVLMLDEVLKNAKPVGRVPIKKDNKNQAVFAYMLIMVYRLDKIGTIKLTVGVKPTSQRIQYGLTALEASEPLIDRSSNKPGKTKKRRPQK